MVRANAIPYLQYFHQVCHDQDQSDIVDLLTVWPLWLHDHDLTKFSI